MYPATPRRREPLTCWCFERAEKELKHGNISKLKNRQYSEEKKTGIYTLISSIRRGNYCTRVSRKFSSRLKFIQLRFQHRFRFHVEGN